MKRPLLRQFDNFLAGVQDVFFSPSLLMCFVILYIVASIISDNVLFAVYALMFVQFVILTKIDDKQGKKMKEMDAQLDAKIHQLTVQLGGLRKDTKSLTAKLPVPLWRDDPT